jgi:predicted  nucleic acid-binding Zn-ribbon protein
LKVTNKDLESKNIECLERIKELNEMILSMTGAGKSVDNTKTIIDLQEKNDQLNKKLAEIKDNVNELEDTIKNKNEEIEEVT